MQFVTIGLIAGGFSVLSAVLLTLMVNARHLFYGLSMLKPFAGMGAKKPYMIFSLTDETFSLLCSTEAPEGVDKNWFRFFIALLNQFYWVAAPPPRHFRRALHLQYKGHRLCHDGAVYRHLSQSWSRAKIIFRR
jgi:4-azaleucine resistance transporter AzlC